METCYFLHDNFYQKNISGLSCAELNLHQYGLEGGNFIVNGHDSVKGKWPWQVSLQRYKWTPAQGWYAICGATLVASDYILTAAHCVDDG